MTPSYDTLYLDDAMKNLGEMTEYAMAYSCLSFEEIICHFVISGYATRWEKGDPRILGGLSGTELWLRICEACRLSMPLEAKALIRYDTDFSYWCGYITAFYQWKYGMFFSDIGRNLSENDLHRLYPSLHASSEEKCVEVIDAQVRREKQKSRLALYRKRVGLTQQMLSERAQISRRTIEEYESGRKSLSKAQAERVITLASILKCEPKDLL